MKLGLEAIRELLARLGNPQGHVARVLIGGTNGKGSTAATLSAILHASGIRAGLHTSPHLEEVTERIRVGEKDSRHDRLEAVLSRVFQAADAPPAIPVTYFEAVTAAAELLFREEDCRLAVVEVGLGGRLDATNASEPLISIVTSIGLDHEADLGSSVVEIAREKAGIFRPGRLALCGGRDGKALSVLAEEARKKGAAFADSNRSVKVSDRRELEAGQSFRLETPAGRYELFTPLRGEHQADNVALAVLAAEALVRHFPSISPGSIRSGAAAVRWPARLEKIRCAGKEVWLDGCHNPDGARALARFFRSRDGELDLLFAVMADKDFVGIARELFPLARRVVVTTPPVSRAAPALELAERLSFLHRDVTAIPDVDRAFARILAESAGSVLVAGSLYLVGDVRARLSSPAIRESAAR
jgi:dihydrofolate synthase/folylpolyglutamate synthase